MSMAISHFSAPSTEDLVSLAAFAEFGQFAACTGGNDKALGKVVPQQPSPPTTSDGSPDSFAPAPSETANMLGDDEDDDAESGSEDLNATQKRHATGGAQSNKRGKTSSAERRATHNAIERARRESLNGRFLELANALPTMVNVKRPSKSVIVNKSLEWIYESQIREHALVRENNALRAELNDMRARLQMPPLSNPPALPLASDVARYKAAGGGLHQNGGQISIPISPATGVPVDNYFSPTAAFPQLGALHHPMQYPGLDGAASGPISATQPRVNAFHFSNPFQAQQLVNSFGAAAASAQPSSPTSKSDHGSDTATSTGQNMGAHTKEETGVSSISSLSSISDSVLGSSTADRSPSMPAISQADAMAALQAAHFQQQQFAAFAAAAAVVSQAQAQAGQPAQTTAPWPMGSSAFLF